MTILTPATVGPLLGGELLDGDGPVPLSGVDGSTVASVTFAPALMAQFAVEKVRSAVDGSPVPSSVLADAGELFATARLAGDPPDGYCLRAAAATGVPASVYRDGLESIRAGLTTVDEACAAELPREAHDVVWVPRGRVLGVVASSNHPDPHLTWARALSLGYGVVVRPGGRDPFTPLRLAAALFEAGLPAGRLAVLPGDHGTGERLVGRADLSIVYGGPSAVSRWSGRPSVLVRGPGRSKVLLGGPVTDPRLDFVVASVADDGGVRCTNTSVVLTSGDVTAVADRLASRLASWPEESSPSFDTRRADQLRAELARLVADGLTDHSGVASALTPLPSGAVVARPVVLSAPSPDHRAVGTELPFPFVVVAPWSGGLTELTDSLVLTLLDPPSGLVGRALREPSVRRVVVGPVPPWRTRPGLPHDGSLTSFLLEPKALLRC